MTVASPLDALLARLAADGDEGVGYETLRRRLIRFFDVYVPADADELADVALDRVARRIHEGVEVASVLSYTLGVARMVLHEARARAARRRVAEIDPTLLPDDENTESRDIEVALAALSHCLDAAGGDGRTLILEYYGADGASRIALRQRLAHERGISLNALRNRALRLREALEDCVRRRLGAEASP